MAAKIKVFFAITQSWLQCSLQVPEMETQQVSGDGHSWAGMGGKVILRIGLKFLIEFSQELRLCIQKTLFKLDLKPYLKVQVKFYCPQTVV